MKNEFVPQETLVDCVLNMAHDAIIATDRHQKIILFSHGAEKHFGYKLDEVIGKPLNMLLPSSFAEIDPQQLNNILNPDQLISPVNEKKEFFGRRKDGTIFQCEASVSEAIYNRKPIYVRVIRDLYQRKRDEETRTARNEYLENLLNYANIPIIVWNTEFKITRFNKAFESLTGRNEMYVIGKSLEILFPPDSRESSMELVRKSVVGDRSEAFEINILHLDGSVRTFLWNSATINSSDGKTQIGTIAQGLNITHRKQAEEILRQENEILKSELKEKTKQFENRERRVAELFIAKEIAEEADKLKTAFLENISHKIRTPLNGIIGFSELLNQEELNTDEIKEFTGLISQSGRHLLEIVDNVLDISKIKTGQVRIEQKPVLINLIFSELLNFFLPVAKAKNISLKFQNQDDQYNMIYTDESKLIQILTNLISNALKFTKSGSIDCGFEIIGDYIQIFVKDTGVGIPSELYNEIFDRFAHSEQSLSGDNEGVGFGLSITKGLVELLGGKIWVDSIVDKGSAFYFTLPFTPIELPTEREIDETEIQVKRPNRIILIAEDDWISFQYLRTILEKSDITVIHAENGEEAVELVKNTADIDLILMDIKMPVMDGIEATKQIKQLRPDLPIIAQTAYVFSEEKSMISSIGCDQYLAKPLDYAKLKELLNMYLN